MFANVKPTNGNVVDGGECSPEIQKKSVDFSQVPGGVFRTQCATDTISAQRILD
jgi:hypothetical protein